MKRLSLCHGFTMIELLVVIVILSVLAAALVPAVGKFLSAGDDSVSRNNLMRLGRAAIAYRSDHANCYPSAGGAFAQFTWRDPQNHLIKEKRNGRAAGWVYFSHNCKRAADPDKFVGDGNGDGYGCGEAGDDGAVSGTFVNEQDCCTCFDSKSNEGGINPKPAAWFERKSGGEWTQAELSVMNGCLFPYMEKSLKGYTNPAFNKVAMTKVPQLAKSSIVRAYAMNVITSADESLYDLGRKNYSGVGGGGYAIRYGKNALHPSIDSSKVSESEAIASRTALFVELDLSEATIKQPNSYAGDQVWDWDNDNQSESMGFNHEDNGALFAHVCFADGHVESIRDPSADLTKPDQKKRLGLSKWYGSGGLNAQAEKLD
ncbi:MAG: type II secretion system protein [Kiritimatiellia bacterium]